MYRFTLCLGIFTAVMTGFSAVSSGQNATVVIVPFQLPNYINEADYDLAKSSGKSYEELMRFFRYETAKSLDKILKDYCTTINMAEEENAENCRTVYNYMDNYMAKAAHRPVRASSMSSHLTNNKDKKSGGIKNGELASEVKDYSTQFLNVKCRDKENFSNLALQLDADYCLFINQLEIRGDFSDPYKIAQLSYNHTIKIHYTILNNKGRFIQGNFAVIEYPAVMNNLDDIINQKLPVVSSEIAGNIPGIDVPMPTPELLASLASEENDREKTNHDTKIIENPRTIDKSEIDLVKDNTANRKLTHKYGQETVNEKALYEDASDNLETEDKQEDTEEKPPENITTPEEEESEPEPVEETPVQKKYYLIAGSFGDPDNAAALKKKLSLQGYPSEILEVEGKELQRVSVKSFDDRPSAVRGLKEIRESNPDIFIWILSE